MKEKEKIICNAPYFTYKKENTKTWVIKRGCCNRWDCPRCGTEVAKSHYGRIVEGTKKFDAQEENLYFLTLTCRGREMTLDEAMENYYKWTNIFLTAARTMATRSKQFWAYAQVTEFQKRGHPHSHLITTFKPSDLIKTDERRKNGDFIYRSDWIGQQVIRSGLGSQYDISPVKSPEGASRYVAKYMFKPTMFTAEYPRHWRRVRYSRNWPKMPEKETDAKILMTHQDWLILASDAVIVEPDNESVREAVMMLRNTNVIIRMPKDSNSIN